MENEIWEFIPWYWWKYQVSNLWRVKSSHWKWRVLKWWTSTFWYRLVNLSDWKKWGTIDIHRLVAKAFLPNVDNKEQVNHKNWIRVDNRLENLEWCTRSENIIHSFLVLKRPVFWRKIKWIHCIDKSEIFFKSIRQASILLSIDSSSIWKVLNWKRKKAWEYTWIYEP